MSESPSSSSSSKPSSPTTAIKQEEIRQQEEEQQQQQRTKTASSSYSQQIEDANRELEAAISANESFRKNVLEPAASLSSSNTAVLPPSASYRSGAGAPGSYSSSLLAKWASIPAAAPLSHHNNNNNISSSSAASSSSHHHQHRYANPNANNNNNITSSFLQQYQNHQHHQFDEQKLDSLLQGVMLKEAERVDSQIRDTIARDADARAQHLDNVLRGRFAELQAHNESTGKVLQLIGESLKNLKGENATLSKNFEEKKVKTLESVKQQQKDQTSTFESSLERIEKRLGNLEETMQQERIARQTRLDALELRMQELRSAVFSQVEKKNQDLRDEIRSLDADFASLHREWAKSAGNTDELRHMKNAMRDMIEENTSLRSDVRQVKSDVLNLDVFMKVKAQHYGITTGDGNNNNKSSNSDIQTLRESVSYLAASMKHHGILSVEGPSISEIVFGGNNHNNHQNFTATGAASSSSLPRGGGVGANNSTRAPSASSTAAFTTTSTRRKASASPPNQQQRSYDFLYNNNNNDHQDVDPAAGGDNNNTNTNSNQQQQRRSSSGGSMMMNHGRSSSYNDDTNNQFANNAIPPLATTPKNQTSSFHMMNRRESNNNNNSENNNNQDYYSSGDNLPSADEDDRLVRSPID